MYNFLLIDDSKEDSSSFKDSIERLNSESGPKYSLEVAHTYEEGMNKISKDLNGIIVDIKLDKGLDGNNIVQKIIKKYRVPVVIFTGTPDIKQEENSPIKVYKKGEASHEEILEELKTVSEIGLFQVLGGTGIIEEMMTKIFWNNLYPQINLWKEKKEEGLETEKILLRYALSHIQELIDNEISDYITEEMYILPPINKNIKTGSIIQDKNNNSYYIVLSPPCDLVKHNDRTKSDRILICEIEQQDSINKKVIENVKKEKSQINTMMSVLKNKYTTYYYWLPRNTLFEGGYVNFRKVISLSYDKLSKDFSEPILKIQEVFIKNILNLFSSYYARQGQPDFNFHKEASIIVKKLSK